MSILSEYNRKRKIFGNKIASLALLMKPKLKLLPGRKNLKNIYDKELLEFINKNYIDIINKYKNKEDKSNNISNESNIWIFWWQGFNEAPDIVKSCISNTIMKKGKHNVEIITKYNYKEYISIPKYILKKLETGKMTITHFSDIMRVMLLAEYGGIWLDATIFLNDKIPDEIYSYKFYSNKLVNSSNEYISKCKWSSFFLCSSPQNLLLCFTRDILLEYWENYDELINYFFIDYIICSGYMNIKSINNDIECIPNNNPKIYELISNINNEYNKEKYKCIIENTWLFKLSWKHKFNSYTKDNKVTFYKMIIDGEL